jgi:hypothetical protein
MTKEILLSLISALIGGIVGTLLSLYIPKWLFDPRLVIFGCSTPSRTSILLVVNKGKNAAINAIGRITIHPIKSGDVVPTEPNISIKNSGIPQDWRFNQDAYLNPEQWGVGIESNPLHWQQPPNPTQYTLNPGVTEKLAICRSDGKWVDIPSNNPNKKLARLKIDENTVYYCDLLISAENCYPVRYKVVIKLGKEGRAIIERFKGKTFPV